MKKRLFKVLLIFSFLFITFFSINLNIKAANFAYADFKWEEFLEQNKSYWVSGCDEEDDNCYDRIIKTQKKFYTRLYKLLAQYEKKGYKLDDNIIIATVFFGLTPDTFKDPEYGGNAYKVDESESSDKYILDEGIDEAAREYFESEKDSLKTLLNNMLGYTKKCYGVSDEIPHLNSENNYVCNGKYQYLNGECVLELESFTSNYFQSTLIGKLFSYDVDLNKECSSLASSKGLDYKLGESTKEINLDIYWDFLINNNYFDNKEHLRWYFSGILKESGHEKMSDLDTTEYEIYKDDIISSRTRIVNSIKSIIDSYGEFAITPSSTFSTVKKNNYWWPIGSTEVTISDNITIANGEPESLEIKNNYGLINNSTGESIMNNGIDIVGVAGSTNVIAARDGVIVKAPHTFGGSCIEGDENCEGGYGNFVMIQHLDNNYTLYAHLDTGSVTVNVGDSVKAGQVIGKVGNTGKTEGNYLHFEVRVGGDNSTSSQNPINFISTDEPRTVEVSGDLMSWIGVMEGTGPMEGDNYKVYNDSGGVATFGHGITVIHNRELIRSFGLNPDSLTVGALVSKDTADEMYAIIIQRRMDSIKSQVSSKGLSLNDNQIAALISLQYNTGNINSFFPNYEKYGSTSSLCSEWWEKFKLHDAKGNYLTGLAKRRKAECDAFINGYYNMNPYR